MMLHVRFDCAVIRPHGIGVIMKRANFVDALPVQFDCAAKPHEIGVTYENS